MNIKDFAIAVLNTKSDTKRLMAIANLKEGLEYEEQWNDQHKKEVGWLIAFLESDSNDIADLDSYIPNPE